MRKIPVLVLALLLAAIALTGCSGDEDKPSAQKQGQKLTERAFRQQSAAVPYPVAQLRESLERKNLRERLLRTNKPDALGYVYVMSFGKIIGYYSVRGKVSSNQSQMTADQTEIDHGSYGQAVVSAPGDDGSYGANEPGIFFFTTENVMVTTNLDYIWSDNPLPIDVPRLNAGPGVKR